MAGGNPGLFTHSSASPFAAQGNGLGWGSPYWLSPMFRGNECAPVRWTESTIECEVDPSLPPKSNQVQVHAESELYWDLTSEKQGEVGWFRLSNELIFSVECNTPACIDDGAGVQFTIMVSCTSITGSPIEHRIQPAR